jgi:hypothetical protein
MAVTQSVNLHSFLVGAVTTALAYSLFFFANDWLFQIARVSDHISWVFLPAAIRMLAILMFGWAGVVGLFIGSLAVIWDLMLEEPAHALTLAVLSSVPSMLAARFVQRAIGIGADLAGMTGRHLLCFGLAGGLLNSLVHTVYFATREGSLGPLHGFVPMFVGDTLGTLIVLYLGALALRRVRVPVARD